MVQFGFTPRVAAFLVAVLIGGCSLIVEFDRGLIGPQSDGGVDGGADDVVDVEENAAADAPSDAD
ncbi:MAG: hypothetical protein HKN10_05725 [Myxococcales bacterium]|nr:hypothetical protein [Myxococcales bacterium]